MLDQYAQTKLTISDMVKRMSKAYISLIEKGIPFRKFPSVMLWGSPGVGKSQGVRQVAERIRESTGKKVVVTDVRLLLFNPVDLRGIPTANVDKTLAIWLKPQIFQMDASDDVVNILFLDELSAAPQSVQAAAYQITLDRVIGEHKLPENCIVIAAGNRVTDRSVAYKMPKALANRLCHFDVCEDYESWRVWAIQNKIHRNVLGFLDSAPSQLMRFDPSNDDLAFPTPRAWEMVSNVLTGVSDNISEVFEFIVGCIGLETAYLFKNWCEVYNRIPKIKDIISGTDISVPRRPEAVFALTSEIISYANKTDRREDIEAILAYAEKLPTEFRNRIFSDLLEIKSIRQYLPKNRCFTDWFERSNRYWEDYGL